MFAPSAVTPVHLPPFHMNSSVSSTKLTSTFAVSSVRRAAISAADMPLSRHSAPSMASSPTPVESIRLSTVYTPSSSAAARRALL